MGNDWLVMAKWNGAGLVPVLKDPEALYDKHRDENSAG